MVEMDSNLSQKVAKKFYCQTCDYLTSKSHDFKKHLSTEKHKKTENGSNLVENGSDLSQKVARLYKCDCGKVYKHDSGYYRHKKSCSLNAHLKDGLNMKDKDSLSSKFNNIYCLKNLKKKSGPESKMDIFKNVQNSKSQKSFEKNASKSLCDHNALIFIIF